MASKEEIIVAFELYGTLLSMESITQKLADHIYEKAQTVFFTWRKYQLEYIWRLNSMGNIHLPPLSLCYQRILGWYG
jgi:2-haloacid dehalogenase